MAKSQHSLRSQAKGGQRKLTTHNKKSAAGLGRTPEPTFSSKSTKSQLNKSYDNIHDNGKFIKSSEFNLKKTPVKSTKSTKQYKKNLAIEKDILTIKIESKQIKKSPKKATTVKSTKYFNKSTPSIKQESDKEKSIKAVQQTREKQSLPLRRSARPKKISSKDIEKQQFYNESKSFWDKQTADNAGVLLGHPHLHLEDIKFNKEIVERVKYNLPSMMYALDCGAGIGRVTKTLLSDYFKYTDLVEPCKHFIDKAKEELKDLPKIKNGGKARNYYVKGLQDFDFSIKYDLIWIGWCFCFLDDGDLQKFLNKARKGLRKTQIKKSPKKNKKLIEPEWLCGHIIVKENTDSEDYTIDQQNQKIRTIKQYNDAFENAGFEIVLQRNQKYKGIGLCQASVWVLKPKMRGWDDYKSGQSFVN